MSTCLYKIHAQEKYLFYAPLHRMVYMSSEDRMVDILQDLSFRPIVNLSKGNINPLCHLIIIPTQQCNLDCTYCFAKNAHARQHLEKETLKKILDLSLEKNDDRHKTYSFIGGGEPLLVWDLIKWAMDYISDNKVEDDIVSFSITTNGTLLNNEIIKVLQVYNVHLNLSFDILPDLQNLQRPLRGNIASFGQVNAYIPMLLDANVDFSIRSTITDKNVDLMPAMVDFVAKNYKGVKKLHFEAVTGGKFDYAVFFSHYLEGFRKSKSLAEKYGITLYNSISKTAKQIKNQFCNAELCVIPSGDIVACHRVSSHEDSFFDTCHIGYIGKKVVLNTFALEKFKNFAGVPEQCESCFARWNCAGFCPVELHGLDEEAKKIRCNFIREQIFLFLLEIAQKEEENGGIRKAIIE